MRRLILAAAALAAVLGLWPSAAFAGGSLDTSFGTNGIVTTNFGTDDYAADIAIDGSGRIVVGGASDGQIAVARYLPTGSLDPAFGGGDGFVTTNFGRLEDYFGGVAVDSSNRIVVLATTSGDTSCTDCDFALARFTEAGVLDSTFGGGDGQVVTDMGSGVADGAGDLAIDGSGRIVVAGNTRMPGPSDFSDFAVVRYTEAGSLDPSFDGDGRLTTDLDGVTQGARTVALDSSGRIVVAGESAVGNGFAFAAVRYLETGALDTSFSGDGKVVTDVVPDEGPNVEGLWVDGSDRVILSGMFSAEPLVGDVVLVRYLTGGTLDPAFGNGDGIVRTPTSAGVSGGSLAIDRSGRLIVVGSQAAPVFMDLIVRRYLSDGSPDATFGVGGLAKADLGTNSDDWSGGVALDADGRIVAVATTYSFGASDFAVARFLPEGAFVPPPSQPPIERPAEPPATPPASPSASVPVSGENSPPTAGDNHQDGLAVATGVAPVKGGQALLRLRCAGQAVCRGVARLLVRVRSKRGIRRSAKYVRSVVLGRSRFQVPTGKARLLRIRLNRKGLRLLRRAGRRGLRARLVGRGVRNRTVRLKRQQGKRRRSRRARRMQLNAHSSGRRQRKRRTFYPVTITIRHRKAARSGCPTCEAFFGAVRSPKLACKRGRKVQGAVTYPKGILGGKTYEEYFDRTDRRGRWKREFIAIEPLARATATVKRKRLRSGAICRAARAGVRYRR